MSTTRIKKQIEQQKREIERKKEAMMQAISAFSLAESHLALLCAQLERAEERAEAHELYGIER